MKIVILGENGSPHVQRWVKATIEYKGMELHVISFDRGIKFEGVNYHSLRKITGTKLDYFLNLFKAKSIIKKVNPDLIHAHYATGFGFLAAFSGFHPQIITGWGSDIFDSPKNPLMRLLLINTFKKADAISVLSEVTSTEIRKLTNKFVNVIPFGVDINKFSTIKSSSNSGIFIIGTVRSLTEKYGVEYLIRAFAVINKKYPNTRLEVVGDGPLRNYLQNLTIELGIENQVQFYGFISQNQDFEKYITILNSFDVFAILSILDSETFGVAAVEASACAIPVIATSVGGLVEVVEDEKTGIIVPPKDVEATAAAIERLICDENLRIEMGKNGRKRVEEKYTWSVNVQQMMELYQKTIDDFKK